MTSFVNDINGRVLSKIPRKSPFSDLYVLLFLSYVPLNLTTEVKVSDYVHIVNLFYVVDTKYRLLYYSILSYV